MATSLVLCARKDSSDKFVTHGVTPVEKPCAGGCGATLIVAPTSAALPNATFACNECGRKAIASLAQRPLLGIAPGALNHPDDDERRRTLERHGFRQMTREELDHL